MDWLRSLIGYKIYTLKIRWKDEKKERIVELKAFSEISAVRKVCCRYLSEDKGTMEVIDVR